MSTLLDFTGFRVSCLSLYFIMGVLLLKEKPDQADEALLQNKLGVGVGGGTCELFSRSRLPPLCFANWQGSHVSVSNLLL